MLLTKSTVCTSVHTTGGVCFLCFNKCKMTCTYHDGIIQNSLTTPKILYVPSVRLSLLPNLWQLLIFSVSMFLIFQNIIELESYSRYSLFRLASFT